VVEVPVEVAAEREVETMIEAGLRAALPSFFSF
jgi:hypothetical protein